MHIYSRKKDRRHQEEGKVASQCLTSDNNPLKFVWEDVDQLNQRELYECAAEAEYQHHAEENEAKYIDNFFSIINFIIR